MSASAVAGPTAARENLAEPAGVEANTEASPPPADTLTVVLPFVPGNPYRGVESAVVAQGYRAWCWPTPVESPHAYPQLVVELWRAGVSFALVEHDILVPAGALDRLRDCPNLWCCHPVSLDGVLHPESFGLVRFRRELLQLHPSAAKVAYRALRDGRVTVPWWSIDVAMWNVLRALGHDVHMHAPSPVHLHDYSVPPLYVAGW